MKGELEAIYHDLVDIFNRFLIVRKIKERLKWKEVVCTRFWLLPGFGAITAPWNRIYFREPPTAKLRAHEWDHVKWIEKHGRLRFYGTFALSPILYKNYDDIPYEISADAAGEAAEAEAP